MPSCTCQLNKDLLQLLIHKIDTELLKSIFLHKTAKLDHVIHAYTVHPCS